MIIVLFFCGAVENLPHLPMPAKPTCMILQTWGVQLRGQPEMVGVRLYRIFLSCK